MNQFSVFVRPLGICAALALLPGRVALAAPYELTVYTDDLVSSGEAEAELLVSVAHPRPSDTLDANRVWQTLVEVNYGLGKGWSAGVELPAAVAAQDRRLGGLSLELQYVAPHDTADGWYWGVRGGAGRQWSVYDSGATNGVELNPVLGNRRNNIHLVMNPSAELPVRGEDSRVKFQPSFRLAVRVKERQDLGLEYFADWGPIASPLPPSRRDEALYLVWDKALSFGHLSVGWGRGLRSSGSQDQWVGKAGLQFEVD